MDHTTIVTGMHGATTASSTEDRIKILAMSRNRLAARAVAVVWIKFLRARMNGMTAKEKAVIAIGTRKETVAESTATKTSISA